VSFSNSSRPERMYKDDRPIDQFFDKEELLYNRCLSDHIRGNSLLPSAIKFPDWSVNRSKYSDPEDVLFPKFFDWGIAQFTVGDVPDSLTSPGEIIYNFKVDHDPVEDNYAHSEIRTYKEEIHKKDLDVNNTVKKKFRQILAEKTIVIRQPLISSHDLMEM